MTVTEKQHNWAGNYTYSTTSLHAPTSVAEVQAIVARSNKIKALGTRHSFNSIADCAQELLSLQHMSGIVELDREHRRVTIEAGMRYGELGRALDREGYAVHNLASLPHISVAGAIATATHGSGDTNGNLATAVAALELVTAGGDLVVLSREEHGETFLGAVVGLGGLGIVTKLTLDLVPTFEVRQDVYDRLPIPELEQHFDTITASAYSISLFTDWRDDNIDQVWLKRRVVDAGSGPADPTFFGAMLADGPRHPLPDMPTKNCTEQMGIPGPWYARLPHFKLEFTPSRGEELQSEYIVPRRHAVAVLQAMREVRDRMAPVLQISEVRTIAADDQWMSMCYHEDSISLHFTWTQDWPAVRQVLPVIEAQLAPFGARPHWGKLFTMPPAAVQERYKQLPAFQQLLRSYDPQGKFRNAFMDTYIFGE